MVKDKKVDEVLKKYKSKFDSLDEVKSAVEDFNIDFSREYEIFRKEALSTGVSIYESLCNSFGKIVRINPSKKNELKLRRSIEMAHLNIEPSAAVGFGTFVVSFLILVWILLGVTSYLVDVTSLIPYVAFFLILLSLLLLKPLTNLPNYIAARWRLRASNQMVLCILYIVIYLRHTSNLEHAVRFAAIHIGEPLSLDLRKIFWDVETGRFPTIKESLDNYLVTWKDWNLEFVNSFHMVESSLYESSEARRLELLDRSLETILEGTYEKMLYYAHDLKNPITMLHMLGVVLPILGLVILPLVTSFMQEISVGVKLGLMIGLYLILLPILVYSVGMSLLGKRPTGYGETSYGFKSKGSLFLPVIIVALFLVIGVTPLVLNYLDPGFDLEFPGVGMFLDYRNGQPYGVGALLFSIAIPLGIALGVGYYYREKSRKLVKKRKDIKNLEKEFSGSLFQLGNRVGEGMPVELAFGRVSETMKGTPTGDFFRRVSNNITHLGMDIEDAVFNDKNGAILDYPSPLIESSMEILIESSKKGPKVVAKSLTSISEYASRIRRINERLKDLLAEIVSSMKSQISFLAPIIAGVVVGIASMIVNIFAKLGDLTGGIDVGEEFGALGAMAVFFNVEATIPSYYFQIIVGLYVVMIAYILSVLSNGIENGSDKLSQDYAVGKNLIRSVSLYSVVTFLVIIIFNSLSNAILSGLAGNL